MHPPYRPGSGSNEIMLQQWLDQEDAWMRDTVRSHGWAIQAVFGTGRWAPSECSCGCRHSDEGDSPPFAYTVGMFGFGHPELLVFGLPIGTAHRTLNELGERVRHGQRLRPGELVTFECWPHRLHLFEFLTTATSRCSLRRSGSTVPTRPGRCRRSSACGTTGGDAFRGSRATTLRPGCSRCQGRSETAGSGSDGGWGGGRGG